MANIFTLENVTDFSERINIDELYEKKRQHDLSKLTLFNKILNRIHVKIKTASKKKIDEHFCWFLVPEIIIGVPKYDQSSCIAYLIDKLKDNKFNVRYIHPNTLFISWLHWVPSYVRTELKKKTGIIVNEFGEKMDESNNQDNDVNPNNFIITSKKDQSSIEKQPKKNYTPINSYKPSGKLVYEEDLLNKIEDKFI